MIRTSLLPKLSVLLLAIKISEFVFSEKYLSFDTFLRPYMDVEGYFPVPLLLFIPAIQSFEVDASFLMEVLADSSFAEVDTTRHTVRPKVNWEKVRLRLLIDD